MISNNYGLKNTNISFGALKKVKCSGDFNPKKHKADFAAFNGLFLSDTFRYLIKNYDVKLEFDKFEYPGENIVYTILHYEIEPASDRNQNFAKKMLTKLKHLAIGNRFVKKGWLEARHDKNTGEKITMFDRIMEYKMDNLHNLFDTN